jgi:uncharacterized protein YcbX
MDPAVSALSIYPIKSLSGIDLETAIVEERGLARDRRWMLVEEDGKFITQREDLGLLHFKVRLRPDGLMVESNIGSCHVPEKPSGRPMNVRVWNSELEATIVSDEIDDWFTEARGRRCHLVAMPPNGTRHVNEAYGGGPVSFADAMPILVLSESSLADLNARLEQPVPINRFRANLILRDTDPYTEDSWKEIQIGNLRLRSTKRCGRCLVTCTDQETGVRLTEPLKTLATYRLYNQNACMGMYYVPESPGEIRIGDNVRFSVA